VLQEGKEASLMMDLKFIASVAERDIDFVLVEELSVNNEFADWFTSRLYRRSIFASKIGVWHSVTGAKGRESDIVFLFKSDDGGQMAVLIENKIDAPPRPAQAKDYQERGGEGKQKHLWDDFITCVVAPAQYLNSGKQTEFYDCQVSYEEIMSFFISRRSRDVRYRYKADLIKEAIEKNRRGYHPIFSPEMTSFIKAYVEFAKEIAPLCGVEDAKDRPAGSTWVMFKPYGIPGGVSLAHQLTAGFSKLLIANQAEQAEILNPFFTPFIAQNVEFGISGKSVTLSIAIPKIDPLKHSFEEEKLHAKTGIEAIEQLTAIYRQAYPKQGN
jgi:hypothetical protein